MAISSDPSALAAASRCFDTCISPGDQPAVKTYLLAQIAGVTDPKVVANNARCFSSCIPQGAQADVQAYLAAVVAGTSTDPSTMLNAARCFLSCIPPGAAAAVANYSLANAAGGSTDPSTLANLARCFSSCIPPGMQMAAQSYLMGLIAGIPDPGTILTNTSTLIGTDPGNPQIPDIMITITVINTGGFSPCQPITVGSVLLDTMQSYANGAALNGLNGGTGWCRTAAYVDRTAYLGLQALDTMESYTNGANLVGLNGGTGWAGAYNADNVAITLAANAWADGSTPVTIAAVATGGFPAYTYQWYKDGIALSNAGHYSGVTTATLTITSFDVTDEASFTVKVTDTTARVFTSSACVTHEALTAGQLWAQQVNVNGGDWPAIATVNAADTFNAAISGLAARIYHLNFIAPDSLVAALTPFIATVGAKLWTKHTRGVPPAESITVVGLKAATNDTNGIVYDTGFAPSGVAAWTASNGGMSVYAGEAVPPSSTSDLSGSFDGVSAAIGIQANNGTNHLFILWDTTQRIQYIAAAAGGFYMASRTAANLLTAYFANSGNAWASTGTNVNNTGRTPNAQNIGVCGEIQAGPVYATNPSRISFVAYHDGFNSADGQTLFNAVQSLRTSLGGGFV